MVLTEVIIHKSGLEFWLVCVGRLSESEFTEFTNLQDAHLGLQLSYKAAAAEKGTKAER